MSSYMWNPAYYLKQEGQYSTAQYDQPIISNNLYSPLNSSCETDSSKSSICNSSYLESPLTSASQYGSYKSSNQNETETSFYAPSFFNNQSYPQANTADHQQQHRFNCYTPQQNKIYSPARSEFDNQTNYYNYYYAQGNSTPVNQATLYSHSASTSQSLSPESIEPASQFYASPPKDQVAKPEPVVGKQKTKAPAKGPQEVEGPKSNRNVKVKMEDTGIWSKFSQAGTEMIVTKSGRRMFPSLRVSVSGLNSTSRYNLIVDIVPADDERYKFQAGKWLVSGKADAHFSGRGYLHPDSALTGAQWMKHIVSFHKLKITNNPFDRAGHIILNSMQKFVPRLHLIEVEGKSSNTFVFPEASFMAVTAYQNDLITKLKIEYNPFAKGFRECQSRRELQEKREADEVLESGYGKMPSYSMVAHF